MPVLTKIGTNSINDNAVTNAKIGVDAVSTTEIANDAVTAAKIPAGAVVADIADDAITGAKFANDIAISTTGNIATTGSGTLTVAGVTNLASVATGTLASAVVVPASAGSSMVLLHDVDCSTGSPTEITIINGSNGVVFDSTYLQYRLVFTNVIPTTSERNLQMQVGNGSAYDTSCRGGITAFAHDGSNSGYSNSQQVFGSGDGFYMKSFSTGNADSLGGVCGVMDIFNPSNSSYPTVSTVQLVYVNTSGVMYGGSGFCTTYDAQVTDRMKFSFSSSNVFKSGKITLYGIKNA